MTTQGWHRLRLYMDSFAESMRRAVASVTLFAAALQGREAIVATDSDGVTRVHVRR